MIGLAGFRHRFAFGLAGAAGGLAGILNSDSQCDASTTNDKLSALESRLATLELQIAQKTNCAFVFIKPHAVTAGVKQLVKENFAKNKITIKSQGELDYKTIDEKRLIDNHYGAIADKALNLKPAQLNPTAKAKGAFQKAFGLTWEEALAKGTVYNAGDACAKLGVDGEGLDALWSKTTKGVNLIKFGGGFYVGQIGDIFVVNGFYMSMRGKFTTAPASIYYYTAEWEAADLSWEDFRGKVLGATDPATAEPGSVRRAVLDGWKDLGLASEPNTGDNGVHASASPFEALSERMNWLNVGLYEDDYAKGMLASGISEDTIMAWRQDPQVKVGDNMVSLFDSLEDISAAECLAKSKEIADAN